MTKTNASSRRPASWMRAFVVVAAGAASTSVGCADGGDGDDDAGEEEDITEVACEHMIEGPASAHDATTSAPFPDVTAEHTRHDVALVDVAGGKGGSVAYEAASETDYAVFLSVDIPIAFYDSSGAELAVEESAAVDACDEVAVQKTVELPVGTVELRLGPTTETSVSLVIEAAGGHDH